MASGFFEKYSDVILTSINQLGSSYQSEYASGVMTLAAAAVTLFILVKGYSVLAGKSQVPIQDLAWDLTRFAVILAFVQNTGGYLTSSTDALQGLKEGFSGNQNIWSLLDQLWGLTQSIGEKIYNSDDSYIPVEGGIGMLFAWCGSIVLMLIASVVYTSADVIMSLLTITAPIFIFCLMFGFLRTMFNNWLMLMFSSILTVLFTSLVISIGMDYMKDIMNQLNNGIDTANIVTSGMMTFAVGVLVAFLVWLASKFAMQLAGVGVDAAVQGMGMAGIAATGFMAANSAMKAGRFGKGYYDGVKGNELNQNSPLSKRLGHGFGGKDKEAVKTAWQTSRAVMEKARKRVSNG